MRRRYMFGKCSSALMFLSVVCASGDLLAQTFQYNPPGQLKPGSGTGRVDDMAYVPGMRYPLESAPSYPNSQVWGKGGLNGGGGGQCDAENYSYPWWDNFCETRGWDVPMCPGGKGHQGQDIRPATCEKNVHWAVAAEAGEITNIGSYTVTLVGSSGTKHRYLHMEPTSLQVSVGSKVSRGDRLGRVSNSFGDTATTIHLHYDIFQTVSGVGPSFVPPYMSLVRSYEELIGMPAEPCGVIAGSGGIIDDRDKCFRLAGSVQFWREVEGEGYGNRLYWTYAFTSANPGAWAQWDFDFAEAGEYEVSVYLTPTQASSKRARYVVRYGGKMETVELDISTDNDGWRSLGKFNFSQGGNGQSLSVYDNTGEESGAQLKIPADAVQLTRTDVPIDSEDMGVPTPDDMGPGASTDMGGSSSDMGGSSKTPDMGTTGGDRPGGSVDMGGGVEETPRTGAANTSSCGGCQSSDGGSRTPAGEALLLLLGFGLLRRRRSSRVGL